MKALKIFFTLVVVLGSMQANAQYILLTTQEQVDKLDDIYFAGRLKVTTEQGQDSSSMITSLEPLAKLDSVRELVIENTILTSLKGLENLKEAHYGLTVYNNPFLEDITALNGIEEVGRLGQGAAIHIRDNSELKAIPEFTSLRLFSKFNLVSNKKLVSFKIILPSNTGVGFLDGGLTIRDNASLINFNVRGFRAVGVSDNPSLESYFAETTVSEGSFYIVNNANLTEIFGYGSYDEIGYFSIYDNPKLENMCFVKNILIKGDTSIGYIDTLQGNGIGANSIEEILAQDCSNWNSVEDQTWLVDLSVFPNPTSSTLNINFEQTQEATIYVYSLTGALVLERQINTQNVQLDVSGLPEGMYVVRVKTAQGVESQKVVISR